MNIQIGKVTISMENTYLYGELHVQDIRRIARQYDLQVQSEPRKWIEYPWVHFVEIDGFRFYECSKTEQIELID